MTKKKTVTWTIWQFPWKLKNGFVGMVKAKGLTVPEVLAELITEWLKKQDLGGILESDD